MAAVEEESGRLDASQVRTLAAVRKGYTPFKENDVIFAKITPCMENGKIALAEGLKNGLAYGSTEFLVFRPYDGLLPRFVLRFLLQSSLRQEAERHMTGAVGQKRVPSIYLLRHSFPLPPAREQGRIVAKLDALLSRVAAGEAATRRASDRLQRYRDAVIHAAVTGELTRDWRKSNKPGEPSAVLLSRILRDRRAGWEEAETKRLHASGKPLKDDKWKKRYREPISPGPSGEALPKDWSWATLDQLCPVFVDSAHRTPKYGRSGIPAIGPRDIVGGVLDLQHARTVSKSEFDIQTNRRVPQPETLSIAGN
jgi:type I restriction enzyme S subunit